MMLLLSSNLIAICTLHMAVWITSLLRRDASLVDLFWGIGFVLIAWLTIWNVDEPSPLCWLLVSMVTLWGLRLSWYLAWRNWGKQEDYRYAKMRSHWGGWFPIVSLFTVFLLQAGLTWIIALPVQMGISRGGGFGVVAAIGTSVWAVGLFFETVGDYQLARFKADPTNQGKVMDRGLWRYTRHPNYFGDFLVWWGLYLTSTESGVIWPTLVGPVLMSVLLMKVSGVTLLEGSLKSRVDGYQNYVKSTSSFFPWFSKNIE
jgi:steroid 5-alpha reductase family enzyme